jgi:hypothetical protein
MYIVIFSIGWSRRILPEGEIGRVGMARIAGRV